MASESRWRRGVKVDKGHKMATLKEVFRIFESLLFEFRLHSSSAIRTHLHVRSDDQATTHAKQTP